MRFKVDENVGQPGVDLLRVAGHDVASVRDEGLGGERDEVVFDECRAERRALITLDHDFGNVLRFPPEAAYGIVVLELSPRPNMASLRRRLEEFLLVFADRPLAGELWTSVRLGRATRAEDPRRGAGRKYSDMKYEPSVVASGSFVATPEQAFDCSAGVYLHG